MNAATKKELRRLARLLERSAREEEKNAARFEAAGLKSTRTFTQGAAHGIRYSARELKAAARGTR